MTNKEVINELIATVTELQEQSGRHSKGINAHIRPIGDLPGFDSINGVELAISLSARLNVEIDEKLILSPVKGKSPSITEIAERILMSCYSEGAEK